MKIDPANFNYLVEQALTNNQVASMRPVIDTANAPERISVPVSNNR